MAIRDLFSKKQVCHFLVTDEGEIAKKYNHFMEFLANNRAALGIISELEQLYYGSTPFPRREPTVWAGEYFPAMTSAFSFGSGRTLRARSIFLYEVPTIMAVAFAEADLPPVPAIGGTALNLPYSLLQSSRRLSTASMQRSRSASVMFRPMIFDVKNF
jgi:hypothetical protein